MGGMVLETNMNEIITQVDAQNKMEKSEVSVTLPIHCMYDLIPRSYFPRYCIQYAGMCVCCTLHASLQWPCGCSLPTLECFVLFFGLFSCRCTALDTDQDSTHIPQYKKKNHSHHFSHYYGDLTVPLSDASPESVIIESLNHLIFDII